jgi:uracil-DNA glycosylase
MPPADETQILDAAALTQLLRWYADMGVDMAVDAAAHDRFAEARAAKAAPAAPSERRPPPPNSANPVSSSAESARFGSARPGSRGPVSQIMKPGADPVAASLSADLVAQSAAEAAASAHTLDELREKLLAFEGCGLKSTATLLVFADGNPKADLMIIGEAPGAEEDRIGRPFVGPAGQLLDKMLAAIGLDRSKVYIANVVPWRPPGNRTPTPLETAACLPFLRRQIALADPKILVCLGLPSTQTLLATKEGMMRLRGRWFDYDLRDGSDSKTIPVIAMLHPAYLLRQPSHKKFAWADLRALAKRMRTLGIAV